MHPNRPRDSSTMKGANMFRMVGSCVLVLCLGLPAFAAPEDDALKKGTEAQNKGDLDGAIAAFSEAIRLNPKSAQAFAFRGHTYRDKGQLDKAIADLDESIRLDPT